MNQQKTRLTVLARFPDLNEGQYQTEVCRESKGFSGILAASGRLIGQAVAAKLLAGMAMFLLVGAVLPCCISKNPSPSDSPVASAVVSAATTILKTEPALPAAPRPAVRVVAATVAASAPAKLPPASAKKPVETGLMSTWTPPADTAAQPTAVSGELTQPAAVPPPGYRQADTRSGF